MTQIRRFHSLDGLRGICAVIVLLYHTFRLTAHHPFFHGYLSVDVFFVLSGFVLAHAFGGKLESGMRPADFLQARIRRLGPVIWFAAGFSVAGYFITRFLGGPAAPSYGVLLAGAQSLFLLPMVGASPIDAFPLNGPLWSLFAEFWINVGFAFLAARLTLSTLAAIILAGWTFLVVHALQIGTADFGAAQSTILYSVPRAMPSFAAGVLIFKLWRQGALSKVPSINPMLVFMVWTGISLVPDVGPVFDLVQTIVVAPLMIALLACSRGAAPGWTLWLGRISYPLYATHVIIVYAGQRLAHGPLSYWGMALLPALAVGLADILARLYEPAFRHAGNRVAQNTAAPANPNPRLAA